jgi:hypothetical protein
MFSFNPDLANDNDMDDGDEVFTYIREEDELIEYKELDLNMLTLEALEVISFFYFL